MRLFFAIQFETNLPPKAQINEQTIPMQIMPTDYQSLLKAHDL